MAMNIENTIQNTEFQFKDNDIYDSPLYLSKYAHELKNIFLTISGIIDNLNSTINQEPIINAKNIEMNNSHISIQQALKFLLSLSHFGINLIVNINMLGNLSCKCAKLTQSDRVIPFNISDTLDFCISIFQIRQKIEQHSSNVIIKKEYCINRNQMISSISEVRLKQVLINILSNSYKFTSSGEIVLHCLLSSDNPRKIRIKITDTGIGMVQKEKDNLFKPFKYKKDTKNAYGSGLGMYIIKEILDLFNIELHYESVQHHGSKFWFDLPIELRDGYCNQSQSDNKPSKKLLTIENRKQYQEGNYLKSKSINLID